VQHARGLVELRLHERHHVDGVPRRARRRQRRLGLGQVPQRVVDARLDQVRLHLFVLFCQGRIREQVVVVAVLSG